MRLSQVQIARPDLTLAGLAYSPVGDLKPHVVILSHGYTASKESVDLLAGYLASRGYPCVTFDCRGHKLGSSGGRLDDVQEAVEDLKAVAAWATRHFEIERRVLVGHSMGGVLSIAAAAELQGIDAVCAIAVEPEPGTAFRGPAGQAMLAQRADYVDGLPSAEMLMQLGRLTPLVECLDDIPSLFVAARGDVLVNADRLRRYAAIAGPLAQFVEIEGSHLEAPDRARGRVANWLDQLLAADSG